MFYLYQETKRLLNSLASPQTIYANHIVVKKEIFNAILNHIKKQKVKK